MGIGVRLQGALLRLPFMQRKAISLWERRTWNVVTGGQVNFRRLASEFYEKNGLIFACIGELATSFSEPRMVAQQKRAGEWEEVEDGHPFQILLDKPNPYMTAYQFWFSVVMYSCIAGEMYFEKDRSANRRVVALWPIRPDRVTPHAGQPGTAERISRWEVSMPTGQPIYFEPDEIVQFREMHPRSDLRGLSPLSVIIKEAELDNAHTDFVKAFFDNAAVPFGFLKSKKRLDDVEVERIRERLKEQYQGSEHWHDTLVLDEDAEYQKVGATPGEIEQTEIRAISEVRLCQVFQVPPILVGARVGLEHATYANYGEARTSFWEETLEPLFRASADVINLYLSPEFGSDMRVVWDLSEVSALKEQTDAVHTRAREDIKAGYTTVNEAREMVGLDPVADGDIFLRPLNVVPVPVAGAIEIAGTTEKALAPSQIQPLPPFSMWGRTSPGFGSDEELKYLGEADRDYFWWKSLDVTAAAWEPAFRMAAAKRFGEDEAAILKLLSKRGKASKIDVPFQTFLFDVEAYLLMAGTEWRTAFLPLFEALISAQGENISAAFGISFDVDMPEVQTFLADYTMRFSEKLHDVDAAAINALVTQAQEEGWSVPTLRDAIRLTWEEFTKTRAEMIARTETIRSSNAGAKAAMRSAGIRLIRWLTTKDTRQCIWCDDLDGKVIDIEANFFIKGDSFEVADEEGKLHSLKLDYEDVGYPPLHPLCRCTVTAVIEEV